MFLVTAKHIILGCSSLNNDKEIPKNYPDQLLIGQYIKAELSFTINTKAFKLNNTCDGLDIYVQEIDAKYKPYYNSVEQFISPEISKWSSMEAFGYPGSTLDASVLAIPKKAKHITFPAQTFDFLPYRDSTDKIDSNFMQVNYPMSVNATHGFSGCPLFLQDNISKKWRIIGLLSGGADPYGDSRSTLFFVDIKYILSAINKLLSLKK